MSKNLVIVESPAKAKTLEKFLGKDYKVVSSYGHIADLPSKEIGVNLETFEPSYEISGDKKEVVKKLKASASKAEVVWLASDEDREGEAIAWHLFQQLKLKEDKVKRIAFNSITKSAVLEAIENPRNINYDLVNAQQARRVLDRLVGYELSPVLWKKVRRGLSAGRVQSVAVRLIVERELEVENFLPVSSYRVVAEFKTKEGKTFKARLSENFGDEKDAYDFLSKNIDACFKISDLQVKPTKRNPAAPFTTSTLQQEASRKLGFSVSKTMMLAQRLYESGLITYMRTDSKNLSKEAVGAAQSAINDLYGSKYSKPRQYETKTKGAQEAHEAIRPTDMSRDKVRLENDQTRLYELIWKRTIASQMANAELESTILKISGDKFSEKYTAYGEIITFDGFLKVYMESHDEDDSDDQKGILPPLKVGDTVHPVEIEAVQRFTSPPSRYTEASLVKQLEKLGIGRPSTYAPTISTIQNRGYVERGTDEGLHRSYTKMTLEEGKIQTFNLTENTASNKGKLVPTYIGKIVNGFLVENFENILDYGFTAKVEDSFDKIASGNEDWHQMMKDFYSEFHPKVDHVEKNTDRQSGDRRLGVDPKTKKVVIARFGRYGPMVQIGAQDDDDIKFASLMPSQNLDKITLDEALKLFELPKVLGKYKDLDVEVHSGRYGPYVKWEAKFCSIPKDENPFEMTLERALELIREKEKADMPIASFQDKDVIRGKGRFGPFIKWNDMFINVPAKYDFERLSQSDIEIIIRAKLKKEAEKVVKNWEKEGIRIEKARWKRHNIIKGKKKVEIAKEVDVENMTLEEAKKYIDGKKA